LLRVSGILKTHLGTLLYLLQNFKFNVFSS
jgi:hypothetical protein